MTEQPCEWPILWPEQFEATDAERELWGPVAAQIVWALSGRRYGRCRTWVRPLTTPLRGQGWCEPQIVDGRWLNGPGTPALVQLPRPTVAVHEVRVADAVLPPAAYRRVGDALLRIDGQAWPAQNPAAEAGEPGWWAIDLTTGYPVPLAGRAAAGILAAELIRARRGGKCRLPARAQSIAREGVDVTLLDPGALYEAGLTGLPEVDQWIAAVNPARLPGAATASSPDHPHRHYRMWPVP